MTALAELELVDVDYGGAVKGIFTCLGRTGVNYELCLEEQRLRQEQRQDHNEVLAQYGALPGQILQDIHQDSNQSANSFWDGAFSMFGGGGGGSGGTSALPLLLAAGGAVVVVIGGVVVAILATR